MQTMKGEAVSKYRILIVEDELIIAKDLSRLLDEEGYEVVGISDTGEGAINLALETAPDLVLVDIQLRGPMDGIEAADKIRKLRGAAIVYLTAHSSQALFDRAKQTGPERYLSKPISRMELTRTVELVLYKREVDIRIRETEQRYRSLVEDSFDGIFIQKGTVIAFANSQLDKMLGYEEGELIGKEHWTICHPDQRALVYERVQTTMSGESAIDHYEVKLQDKDGTILDGEIRSKAVFLDGEAGVQSWVRDVSDQKRSQDHLSIEKQRFQLLVESAPFGLVIIEEDGTFQYINPKFVETFGYTLEETPNGATWFRNTFPDSVDRNNAISTWLLDSTEAQAGEQRARTFSVVCKNGEKKEILFRPVQLSNGQLIMTTEDITERRRAEKELIISEANYRTIFNSVEDAIFVHDASTGEILDVNAKMLEMYGYSVEEARSLTIEDLGSGDPPYTQVEALRAIREANPRQSKLFQWQTKDKSGRAFWVEVNLKRCVINNRDSGTRCCSGYHRPEENGGGCKKRKGQGPELS